MKVKWWQEEIEQLNGWNGRFSRDNSELAKPQALDTPNLFFKLLSNRTEQVLQPIRKPRIAGDGISLCTTG